MPDWVSEEFIRRHGLPVAAALAIILVVSLLAWLVLPEHTLWGFWVAMGLGGLPIGYLTPREAIDHRGTNGSVILITWWMTAILMSRQIFGGSVDLSAWVFSMLTFNIASGFCLIMGAFVGSLFRKDSLGSRVYGKVMAKRPKPPVADTRQKSAKPSAWTGPSAPNQVGDFNQTKDSSPPEN